MTEYITIKKLKNILEKLEHSQPRNSDTKIALVYAPYLKGFSILEKSPETLIHINPTHFDDEGVIKDKL